jgi:Helix-turn-helix
VQGLFAGLPGDRVLAHDKDGKPVHTSISNPDVDLAKVKLYLDDGSRLTNTRAKRLADDVLDRLLLSRRRLGDDAEDRLLASRRRPRRKDDPGNYVLGLRENLLRVRKQKGLSMLAVEEISGGEFRHSTLGAYERGERVISVLRLHKLARLYGVSVDQFLPKPIGPADNANQDSDTDNKGRQLRSNR